MGNCWGSKVKSLSPESTMSISQGVSTSKTSRSSISTSTGKLSSMSSSTFGQSTGSGISIDEMSPEGRILESPNLRIFSFNELRSATKCFRPETVLGEGGFGRVFKGWVDEKTLNPAKSGLGMVVAVKKLNPESMQGLEEWQSEVNFLGRLSHPNLVRLLGYCWEDKELLLVYEFMAKGSLENHLFRRGAAFEPLSWSLRLKIAIGAACGLAFLHTSEKQVIYRDFKASNILLDSNYNPKLSDFGLAKNGPTGSDSHVTTRVMGTYGYAAPEYVATGPSSLEASARSNTEMSEERRERSRDEVVLMAQSLETRTLRVYTLAELKRATENFKPQSLIGEGESGKVFRGWVDAETLNPAVRGHGMLVAVKRYYLENMQGLEEWLSEIKFLGRISHPNIVKLLGCCRKDRELLLVYEYMSMRSLDKHLFGNTQPLSWSQRLKIAIGAARGLAFLHASDKQVIFRDFKTTNILLDSDYNAKLSDFGLATNGPNAGSHVVTKLKGTYGYAAPEYIATGYLYVKSDVYGFGVVLLEILSGLSAYDESRPCEKRNLVYWAKTHLSNCVKLTRVMDPKLNGQYSSKGAFRLAQLALRCLEIDHKIRPTMKEVVDTLEQIEALKMRESGNTFSKVHACSRGGQEAVSHPLPLPPC